MSVAGATTQRQPDLSAFARVPSALVDLRQWTLWRREAREEGDDPTKIPYAVGGYRAKSSDPATWATYADALNALAGGGYNGIGIMLAPPLVGIDLDDSLDEGGNLLPWAREWFDPTATYGEVSPSGRGVKFFLLCPNWPEDRKGINLRGFGPDRTGGVEIYGRRRFFTVTGRRYHECPTSVNDCSHLAAGVYARLQLEKQARKDAQKRAESAESRRVNANGDVGDRYKRCLAYLQKLPPSISGSNGHNAFFTAMCEAVRFDLSEREMRDLADWWNANKTDEVWTDAEIDHKIRQAEREAGPNRGERLRENRPGWEPRNGNGKAHGAGPIDWPDEAEQEATEAWRAEGASDYGGNGNGEHHQDREPPAPLIPDPIDFDALEAECPELHEPVIDGVVRAGEVLNIIAGSKRGKTWLTYALALAVASGEHWLGTFPTRRGRVLILDNELHRPTIVRRLKTVAHALGLADQDWRPSVKIVPLRGLNVTIDHLRGYFARVAEQDFAVVVLDAFYKFLPRGMSENDNADMTWMYGMVDSFAGQTGATFVLVHHASKGVQGNKNVTDVGSGAGAISRSADAHLVLRDHEEEGCVVLEAAIRNFAPVSPVGLRFDFPLWRSDPFLDVTRLKRDRPGGRPRKDQADKPEKEPPRAWTPEEFARDFVRDDAKPKELILARATAAGLTEREAGRLVLLAVDQGLIYRHTYPRDPKMYFATRPQAVTETGARPDRPMTVGEAKRLAASLAMLFYGTVTQEEKEIAIKRFRTMRSPAAVEAAIEQHRKDRDRIDWPALFAACEAPAQDTPRAHTPPSTPSARRRQKTAARGK